MNKFANPTIFPYLNIIVQVGLLVSTKRIIKLTLIGLNMFSDISSVDNNSNSMVSSKNLLKNIFHKNMEFIYM